MIEEIRLTLPARAPYGRVARLAVGGVATQVGCSYNELEDLRIAVGEMFGLLLTVVGPGPVTVRCTVTDQPGLVVEATRDASQSIPAVTDLTREILAGVVDQAEIDDDAARIRVVKQLGR